MMSVHHIHVRHMRVLPFSKTSFERRYKFPVSASEVHLELANRDAFQRWMKRDWNYIYLKSRIYTLWRGEVIILVFESFVLKVSYNTHYITDSLRKFLFKELKSIPFFSIYERIQIRLSYINKKKLLNILLNIVLYLAALTWNTSAFYLLYDKLMLFYKLN